MPAEALYNAQTDEFGLICTELNVDDYEPEAPGTLFTPSLEHALARLDDFELAFQNHFKIHPKGERLGKVADWTVQLNQNRLNRFANSGSLNFGDINDLLGEDIPIDQLRKPFTKSKQSSYGSQGVSRWNNGPNSARSNNTNNNRNSGSGYSYRGYTNRKPWDSYRGGQKRGSNKAHSGRQNRRSSFRNQGVINEAKLFKDFVPISSSWNCLFKFDKSEIDTSKPTPVTMSDVTSFDVSQLTKIHQNASLVSAKSPMTIKNSIKTALTTLDDSSLESMDVFDQGQYKDTHVFISANCLAMMLASGTSLHSLCFDVEILDAKKIHVFLNPENFLHLAQLSSSSIDAILNVEKAGPGEFVALCEENTKLNCTIRKLMLKNSVENANSASLKVTKIKLGSQMVLQVVGHCHGLDKSGNPCHLRSLFEVPNPNMQAKNDWRTQLSGRQDLVLVTENKINRFQILSWIISAHLSGVENISFAYTTRKVVKDNAAHSLLAISSHAVQSYLKNILCYDLQYSWEVVKSVLKKAIKLSNGLDTEKSKMVIYYDCRKDLEDSSSNLLKIFECPIDYELVDEESCDDNNGDDDADVINDNDLNGDEN